jgi:hypothetical protein
VNKLERTEKALLKAMEYLKRISDNSHTVDDITYCCMADEGLNEVEEILEIRCDDQTKEEWLREGDITEDL